MATGNADYNAILSTTLANHRDKFEDNVSSHVALWWWLKQAGQTDKVSGGESIVIPLMYGQNTTSGTFSGYDPLSLTPQEGLTAARFEWKNHNVTVAISGEEERKNSGPEAIIKLWGAKTKQAEITAAEDFNDMFVSKTSPGNSGKDFTGIGVLIGDESSSVTTVGGISAVDNTFWRSYVDRNGGSDKTLSLADIGTAFRRASRGPAKPKVGFTTDSLYGAFEQLLQPAQRFTDPKMAEVGFDNLVYQGARVTYDEDITAKDWNWLNSDYLKLVCHSDAWMTPTPVDKPSGIDARYSHIISMGELTISNRKLGGSRLENRTP